MKNKFMSVLSIVFICFLLLGTNVFAARKTVLLPSKQSWVARTDTRTGDYYNVRSRLYAVYPTNGGKDNFEKIQVRVASTGETIMSDVYTLNEKNSSNTTIPLKNGTLGNKHIRFQFRWNHPDYGATADVFYDGR